MQSKFSKNVKKKGAIHGFPHDPPPALPQIKAIFYRQRNVML